MRAIRYISYILILIPLMLFIFCGLFTSDYPEVITLLDYSKGVVGLNPSWFNNNTIAFVGLGDIFPIGEEGLCTIDANGDNFTVLDMGGISLIGISSPSANPSGDKIVFSASTLKSHDLHEIYIMPSEGGLPEKVPIEGEGFSNFNPDWSPDGEWIVFVRKNPETGKYALWKIRPNGKDLERIGQDAEGIGYPDWSPDGEWIVYVERAYPADDSYISAQMVDVTKKWNITDPKGRYETTSCVSPDGKWVCYASPNIYGKTELYIIPYKGGDAEKITYIDDKYSECSADREPDWSPDGQWIVFHSDSRHGQLFKVKVPSEFLPQ
ncbi:MAG: TolB family protein [bacterium]